MNRPPYFFCNKIAQSARFARYQKNLFHPTEDDSSNMYRLKNWNYLATNCNYWAKGEFLQEKMGFSFF